MNCASFTVMAAAFGRKSIHRGVLNTVRVLYFRVLYCRVLYYCITNFLAAKYVCCPKIFLYLDSVIVSSQHFYRESHLFFPLSFHRCRLLRLHIAPPRPRWPQLSTAGGARNDAAAGGVRRLAFRCASRSASATLRAPTSSSHSTDTDY